MTSPFLESMGSFMPIFILSCLSLGYLADNNHPLIAYLLSPFVVPVMGAVMVLSGIGVLIDKPGYLNWHDFFASSTLFVWFAYWHRFFEPDAPMFIYFPYFLAFISLITVILFVGQRKNIDHETLKVMLKIAERKRLLSIITMVFSVTCLFLIEYFLLFPVAITLFIIQYSLLECVKQDE